MTITANHTEAATLKRGFKIARDSVRSQFRDRAWVTSNLPTQTRRDLTALGSHLVRCLDLLDLESIQGLPLDVWMELRDELSDSFSGHPATPEYAALAWVVDRYQVPKQYVFDMINAADYWIRFRRFDTWEQLDTFASNLGGSAMLAACKVMGDPRPGFEIPALQCGKAILLTQQLANCIVDLKANRNFLAGEDLKRFKLEIHRLKMRQRCPQLKHFVRFSISRIEKLYFEAGKLIPCLNLAAARTVTSLLCIHWSMLTRLRKEPELVLEPQRVLSRRAILSLKVRHLLGIEGGIPILPTENSHQQG